MENIQYSNILDRLKKVEDKVEILEKQVAEQDKQDTKITMEIAGLKKEFNVLREDIMETIKSYTDNTWDLINKTIKVIAFLIIAILVVVGIKLGPEVIGLLS